MVAGQHINYLSYSVDLRFEVDNHASVGRLDVEINTDIPLHGSLLISYCGTQATAPLSFRAIHELIHLLE